MMSRTHYFTVTLPEDETVLVCQGVGLLIKANHNLNHDLEPGERVALSFPCYSQGTPFDGGNTRGVDSLATPGETLVFHGSKTALACLRKTEMFSRACNAVGAEVGEITPSAGLPSGSYSAFVRDRRDERLTTSHNTRRLRRRLARNPGTEPSRELGKLKARDTEKNSRPTTPYIRMASKSNRHSFSIIIRKVLPQDCEHVSGEVDTYGLSYAQRPVMLPDVRPGH